MNATEYVEVYHKKLHYLLQKIMVPSYYYCTNHRLRGSASTVLTATGQVNGRWRILTPHRIETHKPTAIYTS